jgi:serine/threonine protein kinase
VRRSGEPGVAPAPTGLGAGVLVGGRWELGDCIGRGASSVVFAARDAATGDEAAVKVLCVATEADAARFVREIGILGSLDHPAIVRHLDHGSVDGRPFVVLERLPLGSLRSVLTTGVLAPDRVARLGTAVADGLAQAHALDIVHRDIKPSNILLDADGSPRLADFGVAQVAGAQRFTATGWSVGTIAYLAPEQARGEGARPASDVYSLGLVLLECLTGRRAFPGTGMPALLARLDRTPRIPASVSPRLRAVIGSMTNTEPDLRPSAADVTELLPLTITG